MHIRLFAKKYWIRRFGEQRVVKGYVTSGREDFIASANVHPLGTDAQQALPEGERKIKHLEGHGDIELHPANEAQNQKGDLLLYHGSWYECTNCQLWDHTVLSHYNYQFVIVPTDGARSIDVDNPPTRDPNEREDGYALYEVEMPVAGADTVGGVIVRPGCGLCIDDEGYLTTDDATNRQALDLFENGGGSE